MKEILQIFNELGSTSGRLDKERILLKNKQNQLFKDILCFVYNPYILTGISDKKMSKKFHISGGECTLTIVEVMDYLKSHNSGRDVDIIYIQQFINSQPEELYNLYKQIFTKSLKCGITSSTINKIFGDLIPEFSIMLAKKFDEHKEKVKGDFVITKKLDGNRCIVIKDNDIVKSFTRQGNQYEGLEEIESDFANFPPDNVVFDGELIADTKGSTIEIYAETTSKARSKGSNKTGLIFHIFDVLALTEFQQGKSKCNCIDRKNALTDIFKWYYLPHCKEVQPLYIGSDLSQIEVWKDYALNAQWEGIMINLDTPYVCKRTDTILKVKAFNDADVKVLNVIEGTGKNVGKLGSITIQFEHEKTLYECNCGSGFSDEERIKYWNNPELIISKIVTIGYFEISKNTEGTFGLRFPTWKSIIRHDKNEISMN